MRPFHLLALLASASTLNACGSSASESTSNNMANNAVASLNGSAIADASGDCAASDKFPLSHICRAGAEKYLNASGPIPDTQEGCSWVVNETQFVDQVLLYRALKCGAKTASLEYAGGAHMAELSVATSAIGASPGMVIASVFGNEPTAEQSLIRNAKEAVDDPAEAAKCFARKAGIDHWPSDAMVVDTMSVDEAQQMASDGPRSACGPYGLDEDSTSYWRIIDGSPWFFTLGQDAWEFDPGSFTIIQPK